MAAIVFFVVSFLGILFTGISLDFMSDSVDFMDLGLSTFLLVGPIVFVVIGIFIVQYFYIIVKNGLLYEAQTRGKEVKIRGSIFRIIKRDFWKTTIVYMAVLALSMFLILPLVLLLAIPFIGWIFIPLLLIPFTAITLAPYIVPAMTIDSMGAMEAWLLVIKKTLLLLIIIHLILFILNIILPLISLFTLLIPFVVVASFPIVEGSTDDLEEVEDI